MNHTKKASNKAGICTYRSSISIDENLEREFIAYIKECYLPDGGFSIPDEEIVAERLAGLFNQKVDVFEFMLVDSSLVIVIRFPESDCPRSQGTLQ